MHQHRKDKKESVNPFIEVLLRGNPIDEKKNK